MQYRFRIMHEIQKINELTRWDGEVSPPQSLRIRNLKISMTLKLGVGWVLREALGHAGYALRPKPLKAIWWSLNYIKQLRIQMGRTLDFFPNLWTWT